MRDGLITQHNTDATPMALRTNREPFDRQPGDVVSLKIKPPAITEASVSRLPVALGRMISEVR
jgi:hypothetical protein